MPSVFNAKEVPLGGELGLQVKRSRCDLGLHRRETSSLVRKEDDTRGMMMKEKALLKMVFLQGLHFLGSCRSTFGGGRLCIVRFP